MKKGHKNNQMVKPNKDEQLTSKRNSKQKYIDGGKLKTCQYKTA